MGTGGEISQCVVVQDSCNRIAYGSHDVLNRASRMVRVRAISAFLVGGLADASDRCQWAVENADDLPERNGIRRFDQPIAAFHASSAGQESGPLEGQKDLLEKLDRNILAGGDFMALQGRLTVRERELEERTQGVLALLRKFHS